MTLPSQTPVVVTRIQNRRGTQIQFDALYPPGYDNSGYGNFPGYNETTYPNVLLAGEIALCTDSGKVFIGSSNGTYFELKTSGNISNLEFLVEPINLVPSVSYVSISQLETNPTPFQQIFYSLADNSGSLDPNEVGATYSAAGQFTVTSTVDTASLGNNMTEVYSAGTSAITFIAQYEDNLIKIKYKHDFPTSLSLCVSTIRWVSI